jgi:very-short-patch-repair endonuclease
MPNQTRGHTSRQMLAAARRQRRTPTATERKLWDALRGRSLGNLKFRRQHAYEGFILDAFCVEHQLSVEIDGGIHLDPRQAAHDANRTQFLLDHGITVLRFTVEQVEHDLPAVLERILAVAQKLSQNTR